MSCAIINKIFLFFLESPDNIEDFVVIRIKNFFFQLKIFIEHAEATGVFFVEMVLNAINFLHGIFETIIITFLLIIWILFLGIALYIFLKKKFTKRNEKGSYIAKIY